ncbi:His-Xaa-Ser system protein HxsD [Arachidicoccus sp.]|uniref:His-Xaa-Ser system protein HxsD n=1 Tax=Arachidicoccus sp. TaxID=1872624 RepID=UPI003D2152D6
MNNNFIKDHEINAFVDCTLFSKESVLKCLYWYGDKFHTSISLADFSYVVSLKPLINSNIHDDELILYLQKFERDLIDFQIRDIIAIETKNIRDILVAKAFSNGEFDEDPVGEIEDPVGLTHI